MIKIKVSNALTSEDLVIEVYDESGKELLEGIDYEVEIEDEEFDFTELYDHIELDTALED